MHKEYNNCHAASNPAKTTFNIITPPPSPQNGLFFFLGGGGGVIFLEYFHEFLGLGHKKNFRKTLGQSRCFGSIGSRTTTSAGTRFQHEAGGGRRPPRPSGGTLFQYEWELWNRLLPRPASFQHDTKLIKSSK